MLVDGRKIALDILAGVKEQAQSFGRQLTLSAVTCAPNFETRKYLEMKKQKASQVGVSLVVVELPSIADTEAVIDCVREVSDRSDGVVVQLPFPASIDRESVLGAVPVEKDPDGFAYGKDTNACLSPVVGAIDEISRLHHVEWAGKRVVVLGEGRLVGLPASHYAKTKGSVVEIFNQDTYHPEALSSADIIVSGIGKPHFIKPELVSDGVVIFDAGTSEDGGVLVGDTDPAVASKASLLTPVPGGIGPLTIACLLRNLVELSRQWQD